MPEPRILLADPNERKQLEPFATIFLEIVVPEAVHDGWFEARQQPPASKLEEISRRISIALQQRIGDQVHPAIYIHALLVCCSFFWTAAEAVDDFAEQDRQLQILDASFSLLHHLMLHHRLHDLYVRLC